MFLLNRSVNFLEKRHWPPTLNCSVLYSNIIYNIIYNIICHYLFLLWLSKTLEEHEHILMCSFFVIYFPHITTINIAMAPEALKNYPGFQHRKPSPNRWNPCIFSGYFITKDFITIFKIFELLLFYFVCCSRAGHHNASDFPCRVPALCWVILTRLTLAKTESW